MSILECTVQKSAPSQYVRPAYKGAPIVYVFRDCWQVHNVLVVCIKDFVELDLKSPCRNIISHHGNNAWVVVVDSRLVAIPSSTTIVPPQGVLSFV
jgi:hypothetical protein